MPKSGVVIHRIIVRPVETIVEDTARAFVEKLVSAAPARVHAELWRFSSRVVSRSCASVLFSVVFSSVSLSFACWIFCGSPEACAALSCSSADFTASRSCCTC